MICIMKLGVAFAIIVAWTQIGSPEFFKILPSTRVPIAGLASAQAASNKTG
jgi:hypothetical protein